MLPFEASHPQQCFHLKYEALCAEPEARLKPMFALLNEPWESSVLEFHRFDHDRGAEDGRVIGTTGFSVRKDNYKQWPQPIIQRAAAEAGPLLAELNYRVGVAGDAPPPA